MISESLNYLRNDEEGWVRTLLIGGILTFIGVLVVPMILVAGYLVRVVRATMHGDEQPPVFDDWGDMAMDGLKASVIAFAYSLVPGIIFAVFVGGSIFALVLGNGSTGSGLIGGIGFLAGGLLALVLSLVAAYVTPAAIANYVETDQVGKGFAVSDLRPVLTSGQYFTAWISAFAVIFAGGLVSSALSSVIPLLGWLPGAFVTFYALVAAYYIIGQAWGDLRDIEVRESEEQPGEQAAI